MQDPTPQDPDFVTPRSRVLPAKISLLSSRRQQLGEAKLVPVRIGDVKESLAPRSIFRRLKLQSLYLQCPVECVYVINSENGSAPPSVFVPLASDQVTKDWPAFRLLNGAL